MLPIQQTFLSPEARKAIGEALGHHAVQVTGTNDLKEEVAFQIYDQQAFVGCVVVQPFWGQLHIKYLLVDSFYRGQGYGRALVKHAIEYGRATGCQFAFVETMSFQAPEFYQKLGFEIQLKRDGYSHGTSFYYLIHWINS